MTYALEPVKSLVKRLKTKGVPVIYFGVDTASLLSTITDTDADVIGTDSKAPHRKSNNSLAGRLSWSQTSRKNHKLRLWSIRRCKTLDVSIFL